MSAILLRHAWAGKRARWPADDCLRPLDERGRRQAEALVPLLLAHGVERVHSSPYARCVETVGPLAAALGVEVELDDRLAEGAGAAARPLLAVDGVVACTHGDVVEAILGAPLKKGAAVVFEDGEASLRLDAP